MRINLLSRVKSGSIVRLLPAMLVLAVAPAISAAPAPIVFAGLAQGFGGAFTSATGLATDASGNVYVSEPSRGRVNRITPVGVTSPLAIAGLSAPRGLVVDASNNLWVANNGANTLTKHPLGGGPDTTIAGFHNPINLALDPAGNLYVANSTGNTVQKLAAGGTVPTTLVSSGISQARGLAVDTAGNLFIADFGGRKVVEVLASTGGVVTTIPLAPCRPRDVAVNLNGDLFVGCNDTSTIYRIPNETGILTPSDKTLVSSTGIVGVHGLTFSSGSLYATNGGNRVDKIQIDSVDLGSFMASEPDPTLATSVTLGFTAIHQNTDLAFIAAYSEGAVERDLNGPNDFRTNPTSPPINTRCYAGGGLFIQNRSCKLQIDYYPIGAGISHGAIVFFDRSSPNNKPVFTLPISAIGLASRVAYGVGQINTFDPITDGLGLSGPTATLIDGYGNRYVSDTLNNRVVKFAQGATTGITIGKGLVFPFGIALDGAGSVYIADSAVGIVKVPNENGVLNSDDQIIVTSDVFLPSAIRFDRAQNLYIADTGHDRILMIPNEDGQLNPAHQKVIGSGFTGPQGVFADLAGNVWVIDTLYNNAVGRIVKVAKDGTQTTVAIDPAQISGPTDALLDIVLDQAGDAYISDGNNARVLYISADGTIQAQVYQKPTHDNLDIYTGLWIDAVGQLYITDFQGNAVTQISDISYPLYFPTTPQNGTSAPQVIQTSNIGNVPLDLRSLTFVGDFQQVSVGGGGNIPDCNIPPVLTLDPGKSCFIGVVFKPTTTGTQNGELDVQNTDLNYGPPSYNVDPFPLNGTGAAAAAAVRRPVASSTPFGKLAPNAHVALSPSAVTFTQAGGSAGARQSTVTVTNNTGLTSTLLITVPVGYEATPSCPTQLKAGESCTVNVGFHPETVGAHDGVLTTTLIPADGSASHSAQISVTGTGK